MRKYRWLCIVLLLACASLQAQRKQYIYHDTPTAPSTQDEEKIEQVLPDDEPKIFTDEEVVKDEPVKGSNLSRNNPFIATDTVQRLKNMEALAYASYLDSLLRADQDKKKKEAPTQKERSLRTPSLSFGFLTPILWILAIAFLGFIVYSLFLKDGAFRKSTKKAVMAGEDVEQEVVQPGSDMDRLIRQALQSRNYRMAIRYQYLNCLYKLVEKGLVQYAVDKTNYQYVSELTNQQQRNEFAKLTLHYDYVWYGEFEIDETVYQKIEPGFTAFYNKI